MALFVVFVAGGAIWLNLSLNTIPTNSKYTRGIH